MKKVHITSLGCAKNLVDSEVLSGQLSNRSFKLLSKPHDAEIIIINTCGFIQSAKEESIQAIFEAVNLKKADPAKQVYVTGCLSQRYRDELTGQIPEIDALFGTEDYRRILEKLGENHFHAEDMYRRRKLSTPGHYAYLKISEGCNHTCAFCAIPAIRGKHRSRSIESILDEAQMLHEQGVKELLLVSQDTSYYGWDLYGKSRIVDLLTRLAETGWFGWIRPLYWYPTNFPMKYVELMSRYDSLIPYLDMPIQHASTAVLRLMRRGESYEGLNRLYERIRKIQPGIALRTTLIVGHPGETDQDFEKLLEFVSKTGFDRIGSFVYSDEENTHAFDLSAKVPTAVAEERQQRLMQIQQDISLKKNRNLIGTIQRVLIDDDRKVVTGRTYRDAPEIDNDVLVEGASPGADLVGGFADVLITDASEYELYAKLDVS